MKSAYAGLLAANNLVVARQLPQRGPLSLRSGHLLPVNVQSIPRLLAPDLDQRSQAQRLSRATATAAMSTLYKPGEDALMTGLASRLVTDAERERSAQRREEIERSALVQADIQDCRYCTLFETLFHDLDKPPEIVVVNHSASIQTDFDLQTNISSASIDKYQLLLPKKYAAQAIDSTHPLYWDLAAPDYFSETAPAVVQRDGSGQVWTCNTAGKTGPGPEQWQAKAIDEGENYLYECAVWPWNEQLTTRVENVIRVSHFVNSTQAAAKATPGRSSSKSAGAKRVLSFPTTDGEHRRLPETSFSTAEARILNYTYTLETCVRSSFGIGWEDFNGLDVDDGQVSNRAIHYSNLQQDDVRHLKQRDLLHMYRTLELTARAGKAGVQKEMGGIAASINRAPTKAEDLLDVVCRIAKLLGDLWDGKDDVWLLEVSASKKLRFSLPLTGAVEIWSALTWMAPAVLFTFLNRAVCQLPQALLDPHPPKH